MELVGVRGSGGIPHQQPPNLNRLVRSPETPIHGRSEFMGLCRLLECLGLLIFSAQGANAARIPGHSPTAPRGGSQASGSLDSVAGCVCQRILVLGS